MDVSLSIGRCSWKISYRGGAVQVDGAVCRQFIGETNDSLNSFVDHERWAGGNPIVALQGCGLLVWVDLLAERQDVDLVIVDGLIRVGIRHPPWQSSSVTSGEGHCTKSGHSTYIFASLTGGIGSGWENSHVYAGLSQSLARTPLGRVAMTARAVPMLKCIPAPGVTR